MKKLVDARQDELKKSSLEAMTKINEEVKKTVGEIKTEKNLDIIISSTSTIFYKDELDISADVIKLLNKKISTVKIK